MAPYWTARSRLQWIVSEHYRWKRIAEKRYCLGFSLCAFIWSLDSDLSVNWSRLECCHCVKRDTLALIGWWAFGCCHFAFLHCVFWLIWWWDCFTIFSLLFLLASGHGALTLEKRFKQGTESTYLPGCWNNTTRVIAAYHGICFLKTWMLKK